MVTWYLDTWTCVFGYEIKSIFLFAHPSTIDIYFCFTPQLVHIIIFFSSNYYIAKISKFPKTLFTRWKKLSLKKKKTLLVHVTWVGIKTFRPENQNQCCNNLKKGKQWFLFFNFVMLLKWWSSIKIFGQISQILQYWKYESRKILSTLSCHRL